VAGSLPKPPRMELKVASSAWRCQRSGSVTRAATRARMSSNLGPIITLGQSQRCGAVTKPGEQNQSPMTNVLVFESPNEIELSDPAR